MIANPGKFQSIIMERSKDKISPQISIINRHSTEFSKSVELLGIEINNHLNFELHAFAICKKAADLFIGLSHSKFFLNPYQRNIIPYGFIAQYFLLPTNSAFLFPKIDD